MEEKLDLGCLPCSKHADLYMSRGEPLPRTSGYSETEKGCQDCKALCPNYSTWCKELTSQVRRTEGGVTNMPSTTGNRIITANHKFVPESKRGFIAKRVVDGIDENTIISEYLEAYPGTKRSFAKAKLNVVKKLM